MKNHLFPFLLATAFLARADVLPPAQDSSSLKGKLSAVTGKATTLPVNASRKGFVLFNLGNLPVDVQSTDIVSARLRVYFPAAKKPGAIAIHTVTAAWNEVTTAAEPGVSVSPIETFSVETVVAKKFAEVDVTDIVQKWRAGTETNYGFTFLASGLTTVTLGAKEGSGSGYPCELDIEIQRAGTIADGSIGALQLADGSISAMKLAVGAAATNLADASVSLAKLASSSLTVTAGTGLAGGGAVTLGGTTTLSLGSNLTLGGTTTGTFSGAFAGNVVLPAGSTTSAPLVLQPGANLTTPAFGAVEFDGTNLFLTNNSASPTRKAIAFTDSTIGGTQIAAGTVGTTQLASGLTLGGTTSGTFSGALTGNVSGDVTGDVTGNVSGSAANFTGPLAGDVTGTQGATVVSTVGGVTAANVAVGANLANAATNANAAGTIVRRDASGNFAAGIVTAAGAFNLPTTLDASTGLITQNGVPLMHTFGTQNFFVGQAAGNFTMTGAYNTASGFATFQNDTTGTGNTASGYAALQFNTTGNENTASGYLALYLNTTGSANTATGYHALYSNTMGTNNTATGFQALYSNTEGLQNTASGFGSLRSNTTGAGNTASGYLSLYTNTTGDRNAADGFQALFHNTLGAQNTASGFQALISNTTASRNVAMGDSALFTQSFDHGGMAWNSDNVAVGFEALYSNQPTSTFTGYDNTALGTQAMRSTTTGNFNTASGFQALYSNRTGSFHTASGYQALFYNTMGDANTSNGFQALFNNSEGGSNTASGFQALMNNTMGFSNTAIGAGALLNNTFGNGNTAIGSASNVSFNTLTNATAIGYSATVDASNKVRIGNTAVSVIEGQVPYSFTSDRNKKENFLPVDGAEVVRKICRFPLTSWNYIGTDEKPIRHYGVMAQDFFEAFGHDALGTIGTPITVNSGDMAGILMSAIQALGNENAALKQQLAERDARDRERDARIARLEKLLPPAPIAQSTASK